MKPWVCAEGRTPSLQLSGLEALVRVTGAGPSTAFIYCLQIFFFAFLMKLSIFIMVLAITRMCYEAALKASDKEKTHALPALSPFVESVPGDKVGHSGLYRLHGICRGKSECQHLDGVRETTEPDSFWSFSLEDLTSPRCLVLDGCPEQGVGGMPGIPEGLVFLGSPL